MKGKKFKEWIEYFENKKIKFYEKNKFDEYFNYIIDKNRIEQFDK
jgi:hypothetical protein